MPIRRTAAAAASVLSPVGDSLELVQLRAYEQEARSVREDVAKAVGVLPGRPYNPSGVSFGPDQPETGLKPLDGEVLPDPPAEDRPILTADAFVTTGIVGSLNHDQREELRAQDSEYCNRNYREKVVLVKLEQLLRRMAGGEGLVTTFSRLVQVASQRIDEPSHEAVKNAFMSEADPSNSTLVNGIYWPVALANYAALASSGVDYFPTPLSKLPQREGYRKDRKYDAALRPSAATNTTIDNVLVNLEYTTTPPPSLTNDKLSKNPLIGQRGVVQKFQQAVTNADDLLTFQPTRRFVPTILIMGRKAEAALFFSVLDHNRLEIAVIPRCFSQNTLPKVAALLHLLRSTSPYHLGYHPLFEYSFTCAINHFAVGDAVPVTVHLNSSPSSAPASSSSHPPTPQADCVFDLTGKIASPPRSTPFGQSTVVLLGSTVNGDGMPVSAAIKVSWITERRAWQERRVLSRLHQPLPHSESASYAPPVIASYSENRSRSSPGDLPVKIKQNIPQPSPAVNQRHCEIFALDSPDDGTRVYLANSADNFFSRFRDLLIAILDAFRRKVLHRDISSGNVLESKAENRLLLVDWGVAREFGEPMHVSGEEDTVTGTIDTMSVAALGGATIALPHDEVESAAYFVLKSLTLDFVPSPPSQKRWKVLRDGFQWNDGEAVALRLRSIRQTLWMRGEGTLLADVTAFFEQEGHPELAKFLREFFALPLPFYRLGATIDLSSHPQLVEDVTKIVASAVDIVKSVKVSEIVWHGKPWVP